MYKSCNVTRNKISSNTLNYWSQPIWQFKKIASQSKNESFKMLYCTKISFKTYKNNYNELLHERVEDFYNTGTKGILLRQWLSVSILHTLCLRLPTRRVFRVSNAANRTDLILWRKKGHSRGTSSVRKESLPPVPCGATDGQDRILASNIIMLLVEAVKSSSSTSVSHKVTRTSCTWKNNTTLDVSTVLDLVQYYIFE